MSQALDGGSGRGQGGGAEGQEVGGRQGSLCALRSGTSADSGGRGRGLRGGAAGGGEAGPGARGGGGAGGGGRAGAGGGGAAGLGGAGPEARGGGASRVRRRRRRRREPGAVLRAVPARPAASQCRRPGPAMLLLLGLCLALPLCAGSLEEAGTWGDTSEQVSGALGVPGRALGAGCGPFPPPRSRAAAGQAPGREGGREDPILWHIVPLLSVPNLLLRSFPVCCSRRASGW